MGSTQATLLGVKAALVNQPMRITSQVMAIEEKNIGISKAKTMS
jgi:hypothetical protein